MSMIYCYLPIRLAPLTARHQQCSQLHSVRLRLKKNACFVTLFYSLYSDRKRWYYCIIVSCVVRPPHWRVQTTFSLFKFFTLKDLSARTRISQASLFLKLRARSPTIAERTLYTIRGIATRPSLKQRPRILNHYYSQLTILAFFPSLT